MPASPTHRIVIAVLLLGASQASAEELLERAVVRNRLYQVAGRFEISPAVGFSLADRLTNHINFTVGFGYHFSDSWSLELQAGYALSAHTGLADQVAHNFLQKTILLVDDLSSLWEMKGNAIIGVRWAPIYGKISLLAELPVHFQTYVWAGGGVGSFHRQSVVYCQQQPTGMSGDLQCGSWLTDNKVQPLASAAIGFRFFTGQRGALTLEVRDYLFPDSYLTGIETAVAESGGQTGVPAQSPGLINLVVFNLGYTFFL
jgi:outer membrane beta-barrel protein